MLRIHSSYHKCLTMLFFRIMDKTYNWMPFRKKRYIHYESIQGKFYNKYHKYTVCSCNGFAIDTRKLKGEFRITRFIRDPRDLIVSGYHYHKKGAEPWFRTPHLTPKYFEAINAAVPSKIKEHQTYAEYLNSVSLEEGLLAELEFRKYHFESMLEWKEHEHIRLYKYEDILGNEKEIWNDIFDFYELSFWDKKIANIFLSYYVSDSYVSKDKHIRNKKSGQWREVLTPYVVDVFNQKYKDILLRYDYPLE